MCLTQPPAVSPMSDAFSEVSHTAGRVSPMLMCSCQHTSDGVHLCPMCLTHVRRVSPTVRRSHPCQTHLTHVQRFSPHVRHISPVLNYVATFHAHEWKAVKNVTLRATIMNLVQKCLAGPFQNGGTINHLSPISVSRHMLLNLLFLPVCFKSRQDTPMPSSMLSEMGHQIPPPSPTKIPLTPTPQDGQCNAYPCH